MIETLTEKTSNGQHKPGSNPENYLLFEKLFVIAPKIEQIK